jgi:hypothetical protein
MAAALSLPFDLIATIPAFATDKFGIPLPLPSDAAVASSDPSVAVTLQGSNVVVAATKQAGSATITLSNAAGLTPDSAVVTITQPQASALILNTAAATFSQNPSPPTS